MLSIDADSVDIIELDATDGKPTDLLVAQCQQQYQKLNYSPTGTDSTTLSSTASRLQHRLPGLTVSPITENLSAVLEQLPERQIQTAKIILLLGSAVGGKVDLPAKELLSQIATAMTSRDRAIISFDLVKDPVVTTAAYPTQLCDATARHLLQTLNEGWGADFDSSKYAYYAAYDPATAQHNAYLVSTAAQRVRVKSLDLTLMLDRWEAIQIDHSQKYTHRDIHMLLSAAGLQAQDYVTDDKGWMAEYVITKEPTTT